MIWTTTPWTMPGNRAIAAGAAFDYAVIHVDAVEPNSHARVGEKLVVALELAPQFVKDVGIATHHVAHVFKGADLVGTICAHPLRGRGYDFDVPLLLGDFVTTEAGTGLVHIAPNAGEDDFVLGREHGLEVADTVGDDGTFNAWVPLFAGLHVYKAHDPVAAAIDAAGGLLGRGKLVHSYPHSWRSRAPLIFRATPNWFIRLDGPERIREKALDAIAKTHFVPEQGRNRLGSMVASRPDWCISRQRAWGVPITVFVDKRTGEPLRDPAVVARIVEVFKAEGADSWYSSPPSRFLGNDRNPDDYEQVMDIVDVWLEAGSTHAFVLEARGMPWPADLYLEGSDQHRGWFQSSLLEAVGTRGTAPFKAVLTDGFVMDEQGRKMSKSLGNVTAPQEVADKFGVDILRLWVMMSDTSEDLRIGPEILKQQVELYRRLRNTLRWLLGSLAGFTEAESVPYAEMPELEKWVLHRLAELDARIRAAVQSYDWTGVYPELHNFCATDLSAFYFDVRKDAVYCDRPDSLRRRAARTVLDHLHRCLTTWLAPVLCFTAEEAWCARFGEQDSVHLQLFPTLPAEWRDDALAARWETIRAIRRRITVPIEEARRANTLGSSLQASVTLPLTAETESLLLGRSMGGDRDRIECADRARHGRCVGDDQPCPRQQVRAMLARAARGGSAAEASCAVRTLRRCGGIGTGLSRVMARPPPPNPLPQGEGEDIRINETTPPPLAGGGWGEGASANDPQPPHPARPRRRHRRAGRRPGQQVVDPRRRPPPGHRPDRPAPGPEPHDGLEQRRHLRPADRLRPVELPSARGHRARRGRGAWRLAPPRRIPARGDGAGRHRGRRAQQRHRPAALRRRGGLHPRPCRRLVLVRLQPRRCRHRLWRGGAGARQPVAARATGRLHRMRFLRNATISG